ncbi:MAG: ABC transporter ATP-binding protein [Desulfopila sp.]
MIALEMHGSSFRYRGNRVVDEVSFHVKAGEFFMILGPNGAGKSSLLKLIAGIVTPQAGEISIFSRPRRSYSARELAKVIALVAQQSPTDFPFSVAETVLMGRSPHLGLLGVEGEKDYALAREAMRFTGVDQFADRRLDQLSGGERQRVMIARAICQEPQIILLDEPTTALDPAHQLRIMDLMEKFRQEKGTTVIMVSHDLNLAASYADRLLLMKNGRVVVIGTPAEVFLPELITTSYECDLFIDQNPIGGVPRVMPIPEKFKRDA